MRHYVCNAVNLRDTFGKSVVSISRKAYESLSSGTLGVLTKQYELAVTDIHTLESMGGRSARSLVALL